MLPFALERGPVQGVTAPAATRPLSNVSTGRPGAAALKAIRELNVMIDALAGAAMAHRARSASRGIPCALVGCCVCVTASSRARGSAGTKPARCNGSTALPFLKFVREAALNRSDLHEQIAAGYDLRRRNQGTDTQCRRRGQSVAAFRVVVCVTKEDACRTTATVIGEPWACRVEAESEHAATVKIGKCASEVSASSSEHAFGLSRVSSVA